MSDATVSAVEIQNSFVVSAPPEQVWELLLDVERVAPCMPGAELTEVIDDRNWRGRVRMRLGPVVMTYSGEIEMVERDIERKRVVLKAKARETSGKGNATATITSAVERTADGGSLVLISQDMALTGMAAQFGSRMLQDVSSHLTKQFADCLSTQFDVPRDAPVTPLAPTELPGLRLAVWAFLRAVARVLHLPWGRDRHATGRSEPGAKTSHG